MRRFAAEFRRGGTRGELGALWDGTRVRPGVGLVAAGSRISLAAGRVSLARLPPLLADAMRLTRAGRRVTAPRAGPPGVGPSRGASAGAIDGGALSIRAAGRGGACFWSFAGVRADSRERLGGVGFGLGRGRARAFAALAMAGLDPFGSITVARRDRALATSIELLDGRVGRALLAEVASRRDAAALTMRWRYRSWSARRVAAEISAETPGPGSRVRMTWRSWSADAERDDGLLEMEWSGRVAGIAPVQVRLGASGWGDPGEGGGARERYGLIDATVARESGRSLSVHALRRASSLAAGSAGSTTVGGRLDLSGRVGAHALLIESTRIRRGATAWGVALSPSGEVTLRSRSKPGLWISARGSVGARAWQLGYELERGEDRAGPKPWGGSLWIRRQTD